MFEEDLTELPTADLLESAAGHRAEVNRLDARLLVHAQVYADRFHPDVCKTRPRRRSCDGRERVVVLGGEGCPGIAEFAVAEFGVMLGVSPRVAADLIGQSLALRHRFPFIWARVLAGEATPWKARQIVAACMKLSEAAARYVDQRVARLVDSITPYRLDKIVRAAKMHADPELARAEADEKSRERGVFVGSSDECGTKKMYIKAPAGAVARNEAKIAAIAEALKTFGDTRAVQLRRADAVGIIADSRYTEELLAQAREHRRNAPTTQGLDASTCQEMTGPTAGTAITTESSAAAPETTDDALLGDRLLGDRLLGDRLLGDRAGRRCSDWDEPGLDDEADRDAPHPGVSELPDPLDGPQGRLLEPFDPVESGLHLEPEGGESMDDAARRALHVRLVQIKRDAYTDPTIAGHGASRRPGQTEIYVHLTDHTLATGIGVLRAEGIGPLLADQLTELIGYGPYAVKPVIDLNGAVSVNTYEIPERIRERVKLMHPVELFPFGTNETHRGMDLDHIRPYDPLGPPGQTGTQNLAPLGRFGHRVKTHASGWGVRRLDPKTLEWTTPHGFTFHVDPTGTHRVLTDPD